jgi:predicted transcriptional regulator
MMKTTIEISDQIYRQVKARASLRGVTMKAYFLEALKEKLAAETRETDKETGWLQVFGKADDVAAIKEVQKKIDDEFSKIDPSDWK